jgi:hypothetical protein
MTGGLPALSSVTPVVAIDDAEDAHAMSGRDISKRGCDRT